MNKVLKLIISIVLPLAVGFTASVFTDTGESSWYQQIRKPDWNPPSRVFGPVWTTLYILMGIALYLVWQKGSGSIKRIAITFWIVQLVLNFLWSFIFFEKQSPGWALVDLVAMWVFILLTILTFSRISKTAAWLMVPYIAWVSFAGMLNYVIWMMNP